MGFLSEIVRAGVEVSGVAVIRSPETRTTREGKKFLSLTLSDRTGTIPAKHWEPGPADIALAQKGKVVQFKGVTREFQGVLEVHLNQIREATDYEPRQFVPQTEFKPDELLTGIREVLRTLSQPQISALCLNLLDALRDDLLVAPSAKRFHHAIVGGLAEHILSLLRLAERVCEHYSFLDRDLVLAGLFLHDIGKVRELKVDTDIDFTTEGRLHGHVFIGIELVTGEMAKIAHFPGELRLQLLHIILSHHGTHEFGAPVLPMTLEAIVVNHLDDLDAKLWAVRRHIDQTRPDALPWTEYHQLLERFFYHERRLTPVDPGNP